MSPESKQLAPSLHFAPTARSRENLLSEGVSTDRIFVTGNTVIDALLDASALVADGSVADELAKKFELDPDKKLILVTGHRRESFGQGFENICNSLRKLADCADAQIIYPMHLNPNVSGPVGKLLHGVSNIQLIPPQDYLPFVYLMSRASIILTDSGGVQEEASTLGKPVLVMRDTTERPEALEAGTVMLAGADMAKIVPNVEMLLNDNSIYEKMSMSHDPYGDGKAASRIANIIQSHSHERYKN